MVINEVIALVGFLVFVIVLVTVDLVLFQRNVRAMSLKGAAVASAFWITLALAFNAFVFVWKGRVAGIEFFTGWLLEKSLSVDNLFVFLVIFTFFKVEARYQRRVLTWGILGALIMRGIFIALGTAILSVFQPIIYVFGAFLVYTGVTLARKSGDDEQDFNKSAAVKLVRRFVPMTEQYHGERFFIKRAGRRLATPLLLVLVVIETTDLLFAVDSIPAVIAITKDPFIVFSSNVMAILGLRALYFLLAGVMDKFNYLKYALAAILAVVGLKMMTEDWLLEPVLHIPKETLTAGTLIFIIGALALAVVASIIRNRRGAPSTPPTA